MKLAAIVDRGIKKVSWEEIKHFFQKETVRLGQKYLKAPVV